jgi:hypothetical protein
MAAARPVTRAFVVHPDGAGAVEALAGLLSDELAARGVGVSRHVAGTPPEGAARADVAFWLPRADGRLVPPVEREVPARLHAAFVIDPELDRATLAHFDALLVPHERLVDPVRAAVRRVDVDPPEVVPVRLPLAPSGGRAAARARRRLPDAPVVLVDLRRDVEAVAERALFQLALRRERASVVLLVPHDDSARERVRKLCERHEVDAWLTSGDGAVAGSVEAVDLFIGRPDWAELALAAAFSVDVEWLGEEGKAPGPLIAALRAAGALGEVTGVLQLAAAIDLRLSDPGGVSARGTSLRAQLCGDAAAFLEVLGTLRPRETPPTGTAVWEAVGPHRAGARHKQTAEVEARPQDDSAPDPAARIEAALDALKARMRDEEGGA